MELFVFIVLLIISIIGLASHILGLPGNFVILASAILLSWYNGFDRPEIITLIILGGLVALGEALEFLLGVIGAKKFKASNRAVVGSIVFGIIGAIWGAPLFFGFGSIIGAFVGAFFGAFIVELAVGRNLDEAINSGWGSLLGRVGGTISKAFIGIIMIIITVTSYFKIDFF